MNYLRRIPRGFQMKEKKRSTTSVQEGSRMACWKNTRYCKGAGEDEDDRRMTMRMLGKGGQGGEGGAGC